jgi:hypothetical protein
VIAWWSGRIPPAGQKRRLTLNEGVLFDCFEHLPENGDPARRNFRYILALLLMRKKRLKFEDLRKTPEGETLILKDAKSKNRYEVSDPHLSESEMEAVQEEVFRVVGGD